VLVDGTVGGTTEGGDIAAIVEQLADAERMGYAGVWSTEIARDPFLLCRDGVGRTGADGGCGCSTAPDCVLWLDSGIPGRAQPARLGRSAHGTAPAVQNQFLGDDDRTHRRHHAEHFCVVGEPKEVGAEVRRRFGDIIDRFSFYAPYQLDPQACQTMISEIHTA
jgi:hypothetical protein